MVLEDRWLRETYVDLLIEYAAKNKDIVILEADLMKAGGTFRFAEKYPERTFDVGIQEMVLASVAKTGCAVTAENHSVIGGLGSAVAELLVEKDPVPVKKVGVMDHFGEVGLTPYLKEKYGLTAKDIIAAAKAAIAMKKR